MAKFLTTSGTSASIEEIIRTAEKNLTLVTPYLQINKNLEDRLQDADRQGTPITIIYGKSKLDSKQEGIIKGLKHIELYYYENLHAKCYYNEKMMVISSMNLYEFSERNNREMGILIDAKADLDIYKDALREVESIKQSKQVIKESTPKETAYATSYQKPSNSSYQENGYSKYNKGGNYNDNSNRNKSASYNNSKEIVPELKPKYSELHNFHLPSLYKTLKEMYPRPEIELSEQVIIHDFPMYRTRIEVSGRIDFIFPSEKLADQIQSKIQYKLQQKMPEIRFYWNQEKLNIYTEKNFDPEISVAGVAIKVNKFIRIIKNTVDIIKATNFN